MEKKHIWKVFIAGMAGTIIFALLVLVVIGIINGIIKRTQLGDLQPDYTADQLASKANDLVKQNDLPNAEILLEQALIKNSNLDYRAELAVVQYRLKKYEASVAQYQKLIDAKHEVAFAWNGIGNAYRDWANEDAPNKAVKEDKAIEAYRSAINADRGYVVAYTNLAVLQENQGKIDAAIATAQLGFEATQRPELQNLLKRLQQK